MVLQALSSSQVFSTVLYGGRSSLHTGCHKSLHHAVSWGLVSCSPLWRKTLGTSPRQELSVGGLVFMQSLGPWDSCRLKEKHHGTSQADFIYRLCAIFGTVGHFHSWGEYQSSLSSTWGSFFYMLSGVFQWYESINTNAGPVLAFPNNRTPVLLRHS